MTNDKSKTKLAEILHGQQKGDYQAFRDTRIPARVENHRAIQSEIVYAAESFVHAAEWLIRDLQQAVQKVRECEEFSRAGLAACDVRSTSLYGDVMRAAERLSLLSEMEARSLTQIDLENKAQAKAKAK